MRNPTVHEEMLHNRPASSSSAVSGSPQELLKGTVGLRTRHPVIARAWDVMEKYDLLENNLLDFINALCSLVDEQKENLPEKDWEILEATLRRIMITHQWGGLYGHLIENYGPELLNFAAWWHFTTDTDWKVVLQAFIDMPTRMLEEYAGEPWTRRKTHPDDVQELLHAMTKRSDIWAIDGWAAEILLDLDNR